MRWRSFKRAWRRLVGAVTGSNRVAPAGHYRRVRGHLQMTMTDNEIGSEPFCICPSCGTSTVDGASFCGECGHPLVETSTASSGLEAGQTDPVSTEPPDHELPPPGICPSCGTSTVDGASFCGECGHALVETSTASSGLEAGQTDPTSTKPPDHALPPAGIGLSGASQSDSQSSHGNTGTTGTRTASSVPRLDQPYRDGYREGVAYAGSSASIGLTDIHHLGRSSRKEVQNGDL